MKIISSTRPLRHLCFTLLWCSLVCHKGRTTDHLIGFKDFPNHDFPNHENCLTFSWVAETITFSPLSRRELSLFLPLERQQDPHHLAGQPHLSVGTPPTAIWDPRAGRSFTLITLWLVSGSLGNFGFDRALHERELRRGGSASDRLHRHDHRVGFAYRHPDRHPVPVSADTVILLPVSSTRYRHPVLDDGYQIKGEFRCGTGCFQYRSRTGWRYWEIPVPDDGILSIPSSILLRNFGLRRLDVIPFLHFWFSGILSLSLSLSLSLP